jgi:hypothetical protein
MDETDGADEEGNDEAQNDPVGPTLAGFAIYIRSP